MDHHPSWTSARPVADGNHGWTTGVSGWVILLTLLACIVVADQGLLNSTLTFSEISSVQGKDCWAVDDYTDYWIVLGFHEPDIYGVYEQVEERSA